MAYVILVLAVIGIIIAFFVGISFPAIPTQVYTVFSVFIDYISTATGILWFFVPREFTLILVGVAIAFEVVIQSIHLFYFIMVKLIKP